MEFWEKIFSLSFHPVELFFVLLWLVCFIGYVVILFRAQKSAGRISQNDLLPTHSSLKISVLIPARNEEKHLKACLEAILSQNDSHIIEEILVLDDHSTDSTRELVENLNNPLIRCISLTGIADRKKSCHHIGC
jgi:cellulose synthase/poly-beta-1,6-N-acetylglucosamine synthase-like glycosyltransferase